MVWSRDMPNFTIIDPRNEQYRSGQRKKLIGVLGKGLTGTDAGHTNLIMGRALLLLTETLGYTAALAWRIVRPDSPLDDESAARMTRRWKAHYRKKYPLGINESFEVAGITIESLAGTLKKLLLANRVFLNRRTQQYIQTNLPDWRLRLKVIELVLKVINLDKGARNEIALGRAEIERQRQSTAPKYTTVYEYIEYMEERNKVILAERAEAARRMELIVEGRQIIEEEGEAVAEHLVQVALAHGAEVH